MNFYNLKDFKKIDIDILLSAFKNGRTIDVGCISIFNDTIGRPGDLIYTLHGISQEENTITLDFGTSTVKIFSPDNVVINDKVIGIEKCSKIIWTTSNNELIYEVVENYLNTKSASSHVFKSDIEHDAFQLYSW